MTNLLAKNTLTNYLVVGVKFIQGFLVTRWTIQYLGAENYGLWAVLWTIFAYSLLLDFGFGATAQKYTAGGLFRRDIVLYNKIISAILLVHLLMSLVIVAVSVVLSFYVSPLFDLHDPDKIEYCRKAFLIFAIGTALVFPTSAFPEMLVGLQKLYIRNYINLTAKIIELFGTLAIFLLGGKVISLTFLTLGLTLCVNLCILKFLRRDIPGLRFSFVADWNIYRQIGQFSWFVYLVALSRLLLNRSSRLIISVMCGLSAVGIFHMSSRLAEFALLASVQYQENIKPMTARLHAEKKTEELADFIIESMKINLCTGLFFMLPCLLFTRELVIFLFTVNDPEVFALSRWFVVSMLASVAVRQPLHSYLLMSNNHKLLSITVIVEAFINVGLDILLIRRFGVGVIVVNSLVIQLVLSGIILLPTALKNLHLSWYKVIAEVYLRPLLFCLPAGGAAYIFRNYLGGYLNNFGTALIGGLICSGIFITLVFFLMLNAAEKKQLLSIFHVLPNKFTK